jgi:hypothetical protein
MRVLLPLLVCSLLPGCLGLGYPSFCKTPTIQLEEPDVHAFRVCSGFTQSGPLMTGPIEVYKSVEKVTATDKAIAPQSDNYFSYYYLAFPFEGSHQQSLEILLYRRGYQLVSVPAVSWLRFADRSIRPQWKKAAKLEDIEKALDSLAPPRWNQSPISQGVRQFVAQEYAWLADSEWVAGPERKEDRQRLLTKANE